MAIPKLMYYQDNSYITGQGTLLEGFETFADWTISGTGATGSGDSTHRKQGLQSLKLNAVDGGPASGAKTTDLDLSAMTNIIFWVYIHGDLDNLSSIRIAFYEVKWDKYFHKTISHGSDPDWSETPFKPGWNRFVIAKADFTNEGSASWSNPIVSIEVRVNADTGCDVAASFDDIRKDHDANAKCIITFDDGIESVYTRAKPIMDGNGQAGVAFVISGIVGDSGRMTKAHLETMRDAGWDISNHTDALENLINLSQRDMEDNIDNCYDWLVANGFAETAKFFCYPSGAYNDAIIVKVKERHVLARSVIEGSLDPHFELRDDDLDFLMKRYGVGSGWYPPATVKAQIDSAIIQGALLILMFHDITADDPGYSGIEYWVEEFEEISDYLKTKEDAEDIEVITFSDYYDQFMPSNLTSIVYLSGAAIVPYPIIHEPSESIGRAEDGRIKAYKHPLAGDRKRVWRIKCRIDNSGSSGYKWRDLEYFYTKVVEGAKRRCVYVDANSVQHLVRIVSFAPRVIAARYKYEVTMILEEDYS